MTTALRRLSPAPRRRAAPSLVVLAVLSLPLGAAAQEIRLGDEFQVNSYTTNYQSTPAVATDTDGDFVVAWQSKFQDGSFYSIFARRFSSSGAPLASEFQVNSYTAETQRNPSVALDGSGDFVVAWESNGQDGSGFGVFARRFSSSGAPLATELQVSTRTLGDQRGPSLGMDPGGDFVVAWSSEGQDDPGLGVFARRFSNAGAPLATEFQVNSYTMDSQGFPSVALSASGDFVVAWHSIFQDGSFAGIFARRFSSAGTALATEFQVNSYTAQGQYFPSVAAAADGDFVVAWTSYGQDGDDDGVFARRFSSAGAPLGAELQVTTHTAGLQRHQRVAAHPDGDFVVAWTSFPQDGDGYGVFARRFSSAGVPQAQEFQVNTYTIESQYRPAVAADAAGHFVIAWSSYDLQDGSDAGVFAQRFAKPVALDLDGDGSVGALTDGLLLLRYLFGFRGDTLVAGAVDLDGCTRCAASPIEAWTLPLAVPGQAAEVREGAELQVNAYTDGLQALPSVAASASGDFVVAWESFGQDASGFGVFARRFSSAGDLVGGELQVATYTMGYPRAPSVAAADDGSFVVVWESDGQDGSDYGVFARRFSATGDPLATELQVNTYTSSYQTYPAVAAAADGRFVVAWQSSGQDGSDYGVFARRFSATGDPLATELQVTTYTMNIQRRPTLAASASGDFVVAWESVGQDGDSIGVFARSFSSAGTPLATELQVNAHTASFQFEPTVTTEAGGGFVAAWSSDNQDGDSTGVFTRRFSSAGTPLATELQVNLNTGSNQQAPSVAADAAGGFVVAWTDYDHDGSSAGVFARRFSSTGASLASEFQATTYTAGSQLNPSVAAGAGGGFVVGWQSYGQDGSSMGVFAQRFTVPLTLDVDGDGSVTPLTDGLLVLRYLFGFRGDTLVAAAVNLDGCTRCDAGAIEAYLAGIS